MKFKRIFFRSYVVDILFFALLGGFLLFTRKTISAFIVTINAYGQELVGLTSLIQEKGMEVSPQVLSLTAIIEPLTFKLQLFVYLIVPLGLYLIWTLTQVFHYATIIRKKGYDLRPIGKFLLLNIPFFILFMLALEFIFAKISGDFSLDLNFLFIGLFILALIFLGYVMQIAYVFLDLPLFKTLKKSFFLSLQKFHILFPLALVLSLIYLFSFALLLDIVIKLAVGLSRRFVADLVFLLISLGLLGYYRLFLSRFIKKKV